MPKTRRACTKCHTEPRARAGGKLCCVCCVAAYGHCGDCRQWYCFKHSTFTCEECKRVLRVRDAWSSEAEWELHRTLCDGCCAEAMGHR